MKKIIILFFLFVIGNFFYISSSFALKLDETELKCYDLINQYEKKDLNKFTFYGSGNSLNDGLTGLDFSGDIFFKKSFVLGDNSQAKKTDLFRYYNLLGISNNDNFFEEEVNFYNINTPNGEDFLGCSSVNNILINGDLKNFKDKDATVVYTTTPSVYEIEEVDFENSKWKIVTKETLYKDRDGKNDVFKIKTKYYIENNPKLAGYYDLYKIVDKYKEIVDWYKLRFDNLDLNVPYFKEIYNKDGLNIKRYFIGNKDTSDPYGIRYRFVNGINFMDDFANYKRHHLFEFLVEEKSILTKNLLVVLNSWDEETKSWKYPQIPVYAWVKYFLGERELESSGFEKIPYYKAQEQVAVNSFYKLSDILDTRHDYLDYFYENIYSSENNEEEVLSKLTNIMVETDFSDLRNRYNQFYDDYMKIKDNGSDSDFKKIIDEYYDDFSHNSIFTQDENMLRVFSESNADISSGKVNNNFKYIYYIIFFLLLIGIAGFILNYRKK